MIDAPLTAELGVLETTRVIVYYDGPRLFTVRSGSGQDFLVFSVDESEVSDTGEASETYLYVALSLERLQQLLSGKEMLRTALTRPPDGRIFVDVVRWGDELTHTGKWVLPPEIRSAWLPTEDARLNLEIETQSSFSLVSLLQKAKDALQPRQAFQFVHPSYRTTEYAIEPLSGHLAALQRLVTGAATDIAHGLDWSKVPESTKQDSQLALVGLSAGSFVVETAPLMENRLLPMSLAERAVELTADLLDDASVLLEPGADGYDIEISIRTASRLAKLLKSLADDGTTLMTHTATAAGRSRSVRLDPASAEQMLRVLGTRKKEVRPVLFSGASLIGLRFDTQRFNLQAAEGEKISGLLSDEGSEQARGLAVGGPERFDITCLETTEVTSVTHDIKVSYTLVAVSQKSSG